MQPIWLSMFINFVSSLFWFRSCRNYTFLLLYPTHITSSVSASVFRFASPPSGPSFGALANQSAPSFGGLAQQGPGFGSQQPSSFSGFGQSQQQAGGETTTWAALFLFFSFLPSSSSNVLLLTSTQRSSSSLLDQSIVYLFSSNKVIQIIQTTIVMLFIIKIVMKSTFCTRWRFTTDIHSPLLATSCQSEQTYPRSTLNSSTSHFFL